MDTSRGSGLPPVEADAREMQSLRSKLFQTYFSFDTRSLAFFRIALGLTCWIELWRRLQRLGGLEISERSLATVSGSALSWVYGALLRHQALIILVVCAAAFTALVLGYRTKWAQLLTLVGVVSLAGRGSSFATAGDAVLGSFCLWSLFMPLGERFSIDSVIASLRRFEQQAPKELNDRRPIRTPARQFYSLACFALLVQVLAIYLLRLPSWLSGDAVHVRIGWVAATLVALAILSPDSTRYTRAVAMVVMPLLHIVLALRVDLGIFPIAMIAFYPLLLDDRHWRQIANKLASWHEPRVVFVDEDCGFCMWCGRLLARLDVLERLEFASNADQERLPHSISLEQANESITTLEPASGRVRRGSAAVAAFLRSLPFGSLLAIPLELPGIRSIAESAYMKVANNRLQVSLWMGYGMCGVPLPEGTLAAMVPEKSPMESFRDDARTVARELCVLVLLLATWPFRS